MMIEKNMMDQQKPYQKLSFIKKKIMLSIWWDCKGVVYFELLPTAERSTQMFTGNNL